MTQHSAMPSIRISRPRTNRRIKILGYGPPGGGKTTLAATAQDVPSMRDTIFFDVEAGDLSIWDKDVDIVRLTDFRQLYLANEFLRRHCDARDSNDVETLKLLQSKMGVEDTGEPRRYNTVVVDSLSEVYKLCVYQVVGIDPSTFDLNMDYNAPDGGGWQQAAEKIRILVRQLRNLPMNVIFISGEHESTDENGRQYKRPAFAGKLPIELMGLVDMAGYLGLFPNKEEERMERRLYMQSTRQFLAKHRFKGFSEPYIVDPTMEKLTQLLPGLGSDSDGPSDDGAENSTEGAD